MLKRGIVLACALFAFSFAAVVQAQQWPTRAVRMINPYAAGELVLPPIVSISRWLVEHWHGGEISGRW